MTTSSRLAQPIRPLLAPWASGPADGLDGDVVVSVTDFAAHRLRDVPGIWRTGLRLRMGWYAMPGAVGLYLWSLPLSARNGSISVWAGEDELRRFVGLPLHVDVMRRYRKRGSIRSATWTAEKFVRTEVLEHGRQWIVGDGT